MSGDRCYIAFETIGALVPDDTNNLLSDVDAHDLQTETTTLVSVSSSGVQGNERSP